MAKPLRNKNGSFIKKTPLNTLRHHTRTKKIVLPFIGLIAVIGSILIYQTFAATAPYNRVDCYTGKLHGYKTAETCLMYSIEGTTTRAMTAALNRPPDISGVQYWSNIYASYSTSSLQQLLTKLLESVEAKRKFGSLPNDEARVTYLYRSTLGREPDSGGKTYWVNRFKSDKNQAKTIASFISGSEALRKMQTTTVNVVNQLPQSWLPKVTVKTVVPRGTYSNWLWNPPATGFGSMEHNLTINAYKAGSNYFWSHQFSYKKGDGGYIGLQSTATQKPDGSYKKLAVFSIFKAAIAASNGCKIERESFDGAPGTGTSCIIEYNWQPNRNYRLKTAITGKDSQGTWWSGWVIDAATGQQTLVGRIKVPPTWQGLSDWSVMWTENFYSTATRCESIPYSKVTFGKPVANGSVSPKGSEQFLSTSYQCTNSVIKPTTTGVTQEVGSAR